MVPTVNPAAPAITQMLPVTIDKKFSFRKREGKYFTLIELVVAIAIVALTLAVAVAALRGESPARKLERTVYEFSAFCARVRFRSAEEGRDWVLRYEPDTGFYAVAVTDDEENSSVPGAGDGKKLSGKNKDDETEKASRLPRLHFKLDKSFSFQTSEGAENQLANGEELEVFRFFPDGGASGSHRLVLKLGGMQKVFSISKLTGRVMIDGELKD